VLSAAEPFLNYAFEWVTYYGYPSYFSFDTAQGVIPGMIVVLPLMVVGAAVTLLNCKCVDNEKYEWRILAVAATSLLVAYPAYIGWRLSRPLAIPAHSTSDSEAYVGMRELVGRPKLLDVLREYNRDPISPPSLARAVDRAASEYAQLDQFLTEDLQIQVQFDINRSYDHSPRRSIIRVLNARALVACDRMRVGEFVDSCIASLRFADLIEGQGMVHDWLTHHAVEQMALDGVHRGMPLLDSKHCRELALLIAHYNHDRIPLSETLHRERAFEENAGGWFVHLISELDFSVVTVLGMKVPSYDWMRKMSEAEASLLATELAIRAYRRDHYGLPQELADLVPKYLAAIPEDPWSSTGEPLRYHRVGQTYTLLVLGEGENVTLKDAFE
jgi:hypothetical protein